MGLTIHTAAEFPLELASDRSVALPGIALLPTAENMPHVKKFEVEISGRWPWQQAPHTTPPKAVQSPETLEEK